MFLIKGIDLLKEQILSILSSVDLKDEVLLLLLNKWYIALQDTNIRDFKTINRLSGNSKDILTNKYNLMRWFIKTKFSQSLPCIVFLNPFIKSKLDIENFFKRGSHHKFLKASDGFAGSGIKVVDSIKEVKEFLQTYEPTEKFQGWILQDALENIATFQKYKFHLRVVLVVVVRDKKTCIYISNYHTYILSSSEYNVKMLKSADVYNTHKKRNAHTAYFPMESPDGWTAAQTTQGMNQITQILRHIVYQQHSFLPDWSMKNGYELFGVDVLFDQFHHPYILEINEKMAFYPSQLLFFPEVFHLAFGGAPLKLFSTLYGTPEGRVTPFTSKLQSFYETIYTTDTNINNTFNSLFHTTLLEKSDHAYLVYQSYKPIITRITRKKHRSR